MVKAANWDVKNLMVHLAEGVDKFRKWSGIYVLERCLSTGLYRNGVETQPEGVHKFASLVL